VVEHGPADLRERALGVAEGRTGRHGCPVARLRHDASLPSKNVPRAFHHLAIKCVDLAACERFYREVLGLELLRRWPNEDGSDRSVWLGVGDGFIALERAALGREAKEAEAPAAAVASFRDARAGLHLFALRISPQERSHWEARFQACGVAVVHRTRFTLYVRDPEGNRIGLSHYPQDSCVTETPPGSPRP